MALVINLAFTLFMLLWVTEKDLSNLPNTFPEKFISLFYFSMVTFTSIGDNHHYPLSSRMRLVAATFTLFVYAGITGLIIMNL